MSKSYLFVNPQQLGPSKEAIAKTDWNKCLLCQEVTTEVLQCPAQSKRLDVGVGQGYLTLASNIIRFSELNQLPIQIDLSRLDEGNGMEATFLEQMAKWHKSCHMKFNATKLRRAEKRKFSTKDCDSENTAPRKYIRRSTCSFNEPTTNDSCFFCEGTSEPLREASTFCLDTHVRKSALDLQDEKLLAKLSAGDMIAQDAKYHPRCLVSLYNKSAAAVQDEDKQDDGNKISHGIALAELLAYIEEARLNVSVAPIFKLADLVKLYHNRLVQLGVEQQVRPHSTVLKNRILAHFPDLTIHKDGRDVLLAFTYGLGPALHKLCDDNYDDEAICLAKAAKIVRRDMLKLESTFTGNFDKDCQVKSVPQSLLALVAMIHNGPSIKSQGLDGLSQATISIAQLMQYNSYVRQRTASIGSHHNKARETPLPIYDGLTIHAKTRKRDVIDTMFDLGLSISYD